LIPSDPRNEMPRDTFNPTPSEIARECAAIRKTWDDRRWRDYENPSWTTPVVPSKWDEQWAAIVDAYEIHRQFAPEAPVGLSIGARTVTHPIFR